MEALSCLHSMHHIRRDVKPANLLLAGDVGDAMSLVLKLADYECCAIRTQAETPGVGTRVYGRNAGGHAMLKPTAASRRAATRLHMHSEHMGSRHELCGAVLWRAPLPVHCCPSHPTAGQAGAQGGANQGAAQARLAVRCTQQWCQALSDAVPAASRKEANSTGAAGQIWIRATRP